MGYERERELNVMNSIIVSCLLQLMMPHVLQTLTSYIICIGHVLGLVSSFCFIFTVPCISLMLYQSVSHIIVEAVRATVSSSQTVDLVFLYFTFHFYFHSMLFFYFLFLEQLGLGWIGHAITLVTT